jgi:hypothetical protein
MRRQWRSFVGGWLVFVALIGGLAAWEAVRVAEARATVGGGWGAGIAAGTAVSVALAGLFAHPRYHERAAPAHCRPHLDAAATDRT